jgi:predicted RNase H-like nuclease (RuvC/YqgF family)
VTGTGDETPEERLARWTATDAAIGITAEAEQLKAQVAERNVEIADLRARLAQLSSRVAQVEADNAELRRVANRVSPLTLARRACSKVYRRLRSAVASRLRR